MIGRRREPHFRGIEVLLECAHIDVLSTSYFKLTPALVAVIVGHYVRSGTFCATCKAYCQPVQVLGTCRIDQPKETHA